MLLFLNKYSTVNVFSFVYDLHNIFFSMAHCIVSIQRKIWRNCKIKANWLLLFSLRLLVSSRLLVKSGGVRNYMRIFSCLGGQSQ